MLTKIVSALLLLSISAGACALCALYAPTAHVTPEFIYDQKSNINEITEIKFHIEFSPQFSELTFQSYDENANGKLSEKELFAIKSAYLDYVIPKNYLISMTQYNTKSNDEAKPIKLIHNGTKAIFEGGLLKFLLTFKTKIPIEANKAISLEMFDDGGFFKFLIQPFDKNQSIANNLFISQNINSNIAFYEINKTKPSIKITPQQDQVQTNKEQNFIEKINENLNNIVLGYFEKIKEHFKQEQNSSLLTLWTLCFLYGVFHAAAPGHSKILISSYFAASGERIIKAFWLSCKISLLHVIGAFFLILTLRSTLSFSSQKLQSLSTQIGGVMIIILAFWLMWQKFFSKHKNGCGCISCRTKTKNLIKPIDQKNIKVVNFNVSTKPKKNRNSWLLVLAASLVPCPGVLLVFVLSFELGSWLAGIVSASAIATGMCIVLFLFGILGKGLNITVSPLGLKARKIFEFVALIVMTILGFIMLNISDKIGSI